MRASTQRTMNRRNMLRRLGGTAMMASIFKFAEAPSAAQSRPGGAVNRNSAPSGLRITDMRACTVATNFDYPIIRMDTNQGVYGLGEVRDGGVKGQALMLKPFLVGANPLDIDGLLSRLKPYGGYGRLGGGLSAIDMALHDIAGKALNVPAYRLVGDKRRDRIRIYADTFISKDPKVYARRMVERKNEGFTWLKADCGAEIVQDRPGALRDGTLTDKGLGYLSEILQAIRDAVGWDIPIAADHFGPLTVSDAIRVDKAFQKFELAWLEDPISDRDWRGLKQISDAAVLPILTGENLYCVEGFRDIVENKAVDIIQPDMETSGGILETKRIGDFAAEYGIPVVFHHAGSPVGALASVHCAATLRNFLVMENHAVDMPWWGDLVNGVPKPIVNKGYIQVPESPGLGVTLNDEVIKEHLRYPGYFEPTPEYDRPSVEMNIYQRGPYPHIVEDGTLQNVPDRPEYATQPRKPAPR